MADIKQWVSPNEIEVTKPVSEVFNLESLKNELALRKERAAIDLVAINKLETQIAELESVPNRPVEQVL